MLERYEVKSLCPPPPGNISAEGGRNPTNGCARGDGERNNRNETEGETPLERWQTMRGRVLSVSRIKEGKGDQRRILARGSRSIVSHSGLVPDHQGPSGIGLGEWVSGQTPANTYPATYSEQMTPHPGPMSLQPKYASFSMMTDLGQSR